MKHFSDETRRRMSESAKKRCTPEWRKKRSERLRTKLNDDRLVELYRSGLTQAEVGKAMGVSQKVIWSAMKRLGVPARRQIKRDQRGEKNHAWKGGQAGYSALHLRVSEQRGRPSKCEVCGTTDPSKMYEWASLTKNYADIHDYKRMCRSCHHRFDGTINNIRHMRKGGCP